MFSTLEDVEWSLYHMIDVLFMPQVSSVERALPD